MIFKKRNAENRNIINNKQEVYGNNSIYSNNENKNNNKFVLKNVVNKNNIIKLFKYNNNINLNNSNSTIDQDSSNKTSILINNNFIYNNYKNNLNFKSPVISYTLRSSIKTDDYKYRTIINNSNYSSFSSSKYYKKKIIKNIFRNKQNKKSIIIEDNSNDVLKLNSKTIDYESSFGKNLKDNVKFNEKFYSNFKSPKKIELLKNFNKEIKFNPYNCSQERCIINIDNKYNSKKTNVNNINFNRFKKPNNKNSNKDYSNINNNINRACNINATNNLCNVNNNTKDVICKVNKIVLSLPTGGKLSPNLNNNELFAINNMRNKIKNSNYTNNNVKFNKTANSSKSIKSNNINNNNEFQIKYNNTIDVNKNNDFINSSRNIKDCKIDNINNISTIKSYKRKISNNINNSDLSILHTDLEYSKDLTKAKDYISYNTIYVNKELQLANAVNKQMDNANKKTSLDLTNNQEALNTTALFNSFLDKIEFKNNNNNKDHFINNKENKFTNNIYLNLLKNDNLETKNIDKDNKNHIRKETVMTISSKMLYIVTPDLYKNHYFPYKNNLSSNIHESNTTYYNCMKHNNLNSIDGEYLKYDKPINIEESCTTINDKSIETDSSLLKKTTNKYINNNKNINKYSTKFSNNKNYINNENKENNKIQSLKVNRDCSKINKSIKLMSINENNLTKLNNKFNINNNYLNIYDNKSNNINKYNKFINLKYNKKEAINTIDMSSNYENYRDSIMDENV